MKMSFTIGDLTNLVLESSECKPVLGNGVGSKNKTENEKAYKDAKKRAKDFDGGGDEKYPTGNAKYEKIEDNGTLLDYEPENEVSKDMKDRIKAQALGYTSKLEMDNKIDKQADFEGNKSTYDGIKKAGQARHKAKKDFKKTGLQGSKYPDKAFDNEELYEAKKYQTLLFKKTTFLTEGHMISRIPDDYKVEGKIFNMKDKTGNQYLVEWKDNSANILEHSNKQGFTESVKRMKELFGYRTVDTKTNNVLRESEDKTLNDTLGIMRKIIN